MSNAAHLIGQLTVTPGVHLARVDGTIVSLINERIQPPTPVTADQIHVRSLRLISDEVNDHGGRFPAEEHQRLCELIVDSPVLVGHDRSQLPTARNFAARTLSESDRQWVSVWFYWMRGREGDRLAAAIDGGVVKEGSIGFEFRLPQCSICGHDIRRCEHIPGESYTLSSGVTTVAHYEYRGIVRVLETSLVYRGANPGTKLGNDTVFCKLGETPSPKRQSIYNAPQFAIVLERRSTGTTNHQYLVARRDPANPSVCDEFTITTAARFDIGDLLTLRHGRWLRIGRMRRQALQTNPKSLLWQFQ